MKQPGRYAAGTKSKLSKWLRALELKRFNSTQDIADYENGVTLKAACLLPVLRRGLYGYLHLGKGRPVVWRNRTGSRSLTFHGDFALTPAAVPRGLRITARLFTYFILSAGTEHLLIAVIKEDLPLVRHALSIPDGYGAAEAQAGRLRGTPRVDRRVGGRVMRDEIRYRFRVMRRVNTSLSRLARCGR